MHSLLLFFAACGAAASPAATPVALEFKDSATYDGRAVAQYQAIEFRDTPIRPLEVDPKEKLPAGVKYGYLQLGPDKETAMDIVWAPKAKDGPWLQLFSNADGKPLGGRHKMSEKNLELPATITVATKPAPVRVERRAWSDRIQNVEIALFPGYLFIHSALNALRRVDLLKVHHVQELVGRLPGDERIARSIPDQEIESLKRLVSSPRNLDPVERLVPGKPVLVAAGPLKGARGIVQHEPNGKRRLVVQIELLGRGVAAELSAEDLIEAPAES